MGLCYPLSEGNLESWIIVGFRPVCAAIGYIGVKQMRKRIILEEKLEGGVIHLRLG